MMQVQNATRSILFSILQLYAVCLATALPATVPSEVLNNLLTLNFTIPYNLTHSATSPSNRLPPDPSYETKMGSRVKFYDYGDPISPRDTAEVLTRLFEMCLAHFPDLHDLVETPQRITVGSVELYVDPHNHRLLTWSQLATTELLLGTWLEKYEFRTFNFTQWYFQDFRVATGTLSRVGVE